MRKPRRSSPLARGKFSLRLAAALLAGGAGLAGGRAESTPWTYRGFTVHEAGAGIDDALQRAVARQIDIVLSVGLDKEIVGFLQSVPLDVVPAGGTLRGSPGRYVRANRRVKLTALLAQAGHKPVLLHEFLHAYHDQRLPGGFRNRRILALYEDAQAQGLFEVRSHMMQNPAEFFACAATTYLFGVTAQEPFHRESLELQPELREFLQKTFGPSCGHYDGKISSIRRLRSRARPPAPALRRAA